MSFWSSNGSQVDMFVKKPVIDDVREALQSKKIDYTVLIEDMQQQINEENPPQYEIEALQNRNGM